ncbi:Mitogen-activated protein kinase kinase kinase 3 [Acropora cervicornis]|uniref:Mitogen-activated protein kinase kinase kinase 3 n=1 Tax=Acropora cervicornis TaxID=6130 RepID=A0AAD9PZQ8_ACRCE|nr:Mitogen-activated protein kinase kinase kinase 3 [Acropora cervicornis]
MMSTFNRKQKAEQEVKILSALKHRFIVEFHHTDQAHDTFLIFMECMEGGSVANRLKDKGPLKEPVVQKFTRQLLDAVAFMHNIPTNPVIHKDIKGANVLLDKLQKNIKLTDFGLCTEMNTLKTATGGFVTKNNVASFLWTSPEMLNNKRFGRNTDIWSVGCTVIEMLTSKPPLMDPENQHLIDGQRMYMIAHRELKPPDSCSSLACRFLERCLSDSEERPSASELLKTDDFVKFLSD